LNEPEDEFEFQQQKRRPLSAALHCHWEVELFVFKTMGQIE